ncbi:MAG TPA: histidine phosphatase family protein [Pseudonocardiaceae bacterium]|jgi:phosphohistidine phosphatase
MTPPRRLVLLRHAKSDWSTGLPDEQRPLAPRGRRDAPRAGRWLRDHLDHIDLVLCSPAVRARTTWELAAAELPEQPPVRYEAEVYAASAADLLDQVHGLPEEAATVVLVGHNPGIESLLGLLTGEDWQMKTAAIAVVSWPGSWSDAEQSQPQLEARGAP